MKVLRTSVCNPQDVVVAMTRHTMAQRGILAAILLVCFNYVSLAGNVLIATTPSVKSHTMNLKAIAKEVEQRGHRVMVSQSLYRPR